MPRPGSNVGGRVFHAISYTFVDRTDSGARTIAFSNFAGAASGGFVGMAYLPDGFNDPTHAGQRALSEFMMIGIANLAGARSGVAVVLAPTKRALFSVYGACERLEPVEAQIPLLYLQFPSS